MSQISVNIGILIGTQDWDTKAFVLKIDLIPSHIRLICLLNVLTFFEDEFFRLVKNKTCSIPV